VQRHPAHGCFQVITEYPIVYICQDGTQYKEDEICFVTNVEKN
jgi:hypothetical protein